MRGIQHPEVINTFFDREFKTTSFGAEADYFFTNADFKIIIIILS